MATQSCHVHVYTYVHTTTECVVGAVHVRNISLQVLYTCTASHPLGVMWKTRHPLVKDGAAESLTTASRYKNPPCLLPITSLPPSLPPSLTGLLPTSDRQHAVPNCRGQDKDTSCAPSAERHVLPHQIISLCVWCPCLPAAMSKLERESRHWPLVYTDTLVYTLAQVSTTVLGGGEGVSGGAH